jgi:hypothetical protein
MRWCHKQLLSTRSINQGKPDLALAGKDAAMQKIEAAVAA